MVRERGPAGAAGSGGEEILTDDPDLEADDIRACLADAASRAGHPVLVAAE